MCVAFMQRRASLQQSASHFVRISILKDKMSFALMTFSSAIFLPSKVANPFSSFHWCLKLPGLFSPFSPQKGMAMPSFLPTPLTIHAVGPGEHHPHSLLVCQDSNTSLPRCLPSHPPSFLHILFQRRRRKR